MNPSLKIYKPGWINPFVKGAWWSKEMKAGGRNANGHNYKMSVEKAYSTDSNIWGATHSERPEFLNKGLHRQPDHVGQALGSIRADRPEEVSIPLRGRLPGRHQRQDFPGARWIWCWANKIGGRHGLGISDQIENPHHRGEKPWRLRRPWHGAALHCLRASDLGHPTTKAPLRITARWAAAWPPALRRPLVRPQSLMLRDTLQKWVGRAVTGEVWIELRRGDDYTLLDTQSPNATYHPERLSMEQVEDDVLAAGSHRQLHAQSRHQRFARQAQRLFARRHRR